MDFTYPIAGVIGLFVGLVGGSILGFLRLRFLTILGLVAAVALLLDAILLINWSLVSRYSARFLAADFGIIAGMSFAGAALGILPMAIVRLIALTLGRGTPG